MFINKGAFEILIVEDNQGDFTLVEDFLHEQIESPLVMHAFNFKQAKEILSSRSKKFDIILLDLSLPDKNGQSLITEMVEISKGAPVIVLTGYSDFTFGVKSLSLGISDYLLKDELTSTSLFKSIVYSSERKKSLLALEESEQKYSKLFQLSPLPMWVINLETLHFLDVNMATVLHYGYSYLEFLSMSLNDIIPKSDTSRSQYLANENKADVLALSYHIMQHQKKDGTLIKVEMQVAPLQFKGIQANIVIANDITEHLAYIKAIEEQNKKLKEIAWMQSHVVRTPLARIMGLINIIKEESVGFAEKEQLLEYVTSSAIELDAIIKSIVEKTSRAKGS